MSASIEYLEHDPGPVLRNFVECVWTLRGASVNAGEPERILPDGSIEAVLNLADRFTRRHPDGRLETQASFMLVGQMTRWIEVAPGGRIDLVGVRFRPGGAAPFLDVATEECTGRTPSLAAASKPLADIADHAAGEPSAAERVGRIVDGLEKCLFRRGSGPDPVMIRAAGAILRAHGDVRMGGLAQRLGMGSRSFERRFTAAVGLGPKMFARIARFQRVFRAIETGDAGWAAIAVNCGYYDQSHLLRDFREFAGDTPVALMAEEIPLTRTFLRANRPPDFSYPPA